MKERRLDEGGIIKTGEETFCVAVPAITLVLLSDSDRATVQRDAVRD